MKPNQLLLKEIADTSMEITRRIGSMAALGGRAMQYPFDYVIRIDQPRDEKDQSCTVGFRITKSRALRTGKNPVTFVDLKTALGPDFIKNTLGLEGIVP